MQSSKGALAHRKRGACRVCGSHALEVFLCLGPTPLANSFLRSQGDFASERFYPLDIYICKTCSLVQLLDVIDPEILFSNYIYVTGTSDTIAAHNAESAHTLVDQLKLNQDDLIVEIASNDGSLLKSFQRYGVKTLGVEPAGNIAEIARANGIDTVTQFFDEASANRIRTTYGAARVVVANNVLAHVDDPQDFLRGCERLLAPKGLIVIEVPYLRDLLERVEYDTIYHEHLCYFSVSTLAKLCDVVGLSIVRMDRVAIHGGSLRMFAGRKDVFTNHAPDVLRWVEQEEEESLAKFARYQHFASEVEDNRRANLTLLRNLKSKDETVAAYGAPAKGNTFLNYCGIDTNLISFTVDKNPLKVGLFTPGMHIPVLPVSTLLEHQPNYVFILAWNFAEEIMEQQQAYRDRGGKFIIPIPEPRVV